MNEIINNLLNNMPSGLSPMTEDEMLQSAVDDLNAKVGDKRYYDCPVCKNKGIIWYVQDGVKRSKDCECVPIRRSKARLAKCGLSGMQKIYTMDAFKADTPETKKVKTKAEWFMREKGKWFFITGQTGGGKTHICSAMCFELMNRGNDVYYMIWRELAPRLKALVNDRPAYEKIMFELESSDVLYIDDFLKGSCTDADINLAFELINHRYMDSSKITIISTERSIENIMDIDEALGGRIYEKARGYCVKAPSVNRRINP